MVRILISSILFAGMLAGPALANGKADPACVAMQASLKPRQQEIDTLVARRGASAEAVEITGQAWEDAEVHRLVSAPHAATADRAKSAYEEAKKQLARDELVLQSALAQFNTDVAAFNARCTR
ncbi:MAG: hypothetical protein ACK4HR_00590 [Hyphomonas sp.]|jgi:hypothetical protein